MLAVVENGHSVDDLMEARPAELLEIAKELEVDNAADMQAEALVDACLATSRDS